MIFRKRMVWPWMLCDREVVDWIGQIAINANIVAMYQAMRIAVADILETIRTYLQCLIKTI